MRTVYYAMSGFGGRMALLSVAMILGSASAMAQQQHHDRAASTPPYGDLHQRPVKALGEQQIADLRAGKGMGLALAAELNGYPGPMHALELAEELRLSDIQRTQLRSFYDQMKEEAIMAGEALIAAETALDRAFAGRAMTTDRLTQLTADVGAWQAKLRAVHLKYHLTTAELLTPHQREVYAVARGYRR